MSAAVVDDRRMALIETYRERFMSQVNVTDDDCWTWRGSINGSGYGTLRFGSRTDGTREAIGAHRFSYELHHGQIAQSGMVVHHECFNTRCVNPAHLALVTQSENLKMKRPGYVYPTKTHCPKGHAYTEDNIRWSMTAKGYKGKNCRACGREWSRLYYAARKAAA